MLTSFAALKISQNLFLKDDVIISIIHHADKKMASDSFCSFTISVHNLLFRNIYVP